MRKFEHSDYRTLCDWFNERRQKPPALEYLPNIGAVEEGLAMGFLVETNTKMAVLDFFISNPQSDKYERLEALMEIAHALILTAKQMGFKSVLCTTRFQNLKQIIHKLGFEYVGEESTFVKGLVTHG